MSTIRYVREETLSPDEFVEVLKASGLAARRPIADRERIGRMLENANLIVAARDATGKLVGVSRALTDFAYCCYLSDLAVDRSYQRRGIGKQLIAETRKLAGPGSMCLMVAAPDAIPFYRALGIPHLENAFMIKRER